MGSRSFGQPRVLWLHPYCEQHAPTSSVGNLSIPEDKAARNFCRTSALRPNRFIVKLAPHRVVLAGKDPVQIGCGADQRQMRECLREVAEMLPTWTNLLRVQSEVVSVSQKFLEQKLRLFQFSSACKK